MIRHRPLVVLTVGFAVGIGVWAAGGHSTALTAILGALGLALLIGWRRWEWAAAGLVLAGMAVGMLWLAVFQVVPASDVSQWAGGVAPVHLVGTVVSDPEERQGSVTLILRVERAQTARQAGAVTGEVYVALMPDAVAGQSLDYGDRVALDGHLETPPGATNPGAFSWRDYLARRAIYSQLRVKRPGAVEKFGAGTLNPYLRLAWNVRGRILASIDASLPHTEAAVLSGILLGRRTDLPPDLMADFVYTGTVHILATAGLHIGIVAVCLFWFFQRLTLPRKWSAWLIILTLWLYDLMAGGRPSVTRAVIMATVYFAAILFEREPDLSTTLAVAALGILFAQPTALLESSFQLSFLTVGTLVALMPVWERFWKPRLAVGISSPKARKAAYWALEMIGLSLLAQVGSTPIVAANYNEVSLLGFFANVLVVPVLFLLIPVGFLAALLGNLWPLAGSSLFVVCGWLLHWIVWVVRGVGETPWAYRAIQTPPVFGIVCYYVVVLALACVFRTAGTVTPSSPATDLQSTRGLKR